jgi:hypothetical protein
LEVANPVNKIECDEELNKTFIENIPEKEKSEKELIRNK